MKVKVIFYQGQYYTYHTRRLQERLRSLERTERMMVRWMCGVSLKDRKRSEDLCNLLGINLCC